jgi:uncharacterized protein YkwD
VSTVIHAAAHHAVRHLRDTFIPHEGNNHRPHAVSHRLLLLYSAMLIVVKGLAIAATVALPSASLYSSSITSTNVIALTNAARHNLNLALAPLATSELLNQAATAKAEDMMTDQYFAHTSPSGDTPWDWFSRVGYRYLHAGENLAVHYATAEDMGEGWMASPGHRANIVNPNYTEIGVGVAYGTFEGVPTHIVVQLFGNPLPALVEEPVAPEVASIPAPTQASIPKVSVAIPVEPGEVAAAADETPPAPIAVEPVAAPLAETTAAVDSPVINSDSLDLQQRSDRYDLSLAVDDAAAVEVQLGGQRVTLSRIGESNVWDGAVPFDVSTMGVGGEQLTISAVGQSGSTVSQVVAWVAPATQLQQLYNFNGGTQRAIKLLGVTLENVNDSTRQVYLYFIVFLGVVMLLNIAVKYRVQHPSIIGHSAAVMALAIILFLV